jgi:hypothetical protein
VLSGGKAETLEEDLNVRLDACDAESVQDDEDSTSGESNHNGSADFSDRRRKVPMTSSEGLRWSNRVLAQPCQFWEEH